MDTVIITGGAGGMGLATARIMGREHHVVLSDVSQERLDSAVETLAAEGITADAVVCDITDRAQVEGLVAGVSGRLGAVVHTAGVSPTMGSANFIVRVNALGTLNVARSCLPYLSPGFALVNVASIAGHLLPKPMLPKKVFKLALAGEPEEFSEALAKKCARGPARMHSASAYSFSKAFVIWYSARMAAEFGARGARVLSISPGSIDTDMGRLEESRGAGQMVEYSALKRFGTAAEVGEVLAFCAGPKAGYLTGVDILVDGGNYAGMDFKAMMALSRGR